MSPPFLPLRRASPGPTGGRGWQLGEERMLASGHRLSDGVEGAWEGRWLQPHHQAAKLLGIVPRLGLGSFAPTTILRVTMTGVMILLLQRWGKQTWRTDIYSRGQVSEWKSWPAHRAFLQHLPCKGTIFSGGCQLACMSHLVCFRIF